MSVTPSILSLRRSSRPPVTRQRPGTARAGSPSLTWPEALAAGATLQAVAGLEAVGRGAGANTREGRDGAVTARLARHGQGKSGVEELILELYYGNLSVDEAEGVARRLWPDQPALALVVDYAHETERRLEAWLAREIPHPQVYVFIHSVSIKRKQSGKNGVVELYAAVGVDPDGAREILAISRSGGPGGEAWRNLLANLQLRGLRGVELFVGPNDPTAVAAVAALFPGALYQGEPEQLLSDALWQVPVGKVPLILAGFDRIRAADSAPVAAGAAGALVRSLRQNGEVAAARSLEESFAYQFTYYAFPPAHWARLREGGPLRGALTEWRGWMRKMGPFREDRVIALLLAARLRHLALQGWAGRRYLAFARADLGAPGNRGGYSRGRG